MSPFTGALVLISLHGTCLAVGLPSFAILPQGFPSQLQCENTKSKRWRHDFDVEVKACRTANGDVLVKYTDISEEDIDELMKLYPGLLKSEDEVKSVPLSMGVSQVPLDISPSGGLPTSLDLPQGFGGPGIQTIGLAPNVGVLGARRAGSAVPPSLSTSRGPRQPARAAAASTRTASFGAGCCSVTREWTRPTVLENFNGALRTIVHFPSRGMYQYINSGRCTNPNSSCASGTCYTEQVTIYLAVFLPEVGNNIIGFEAFSIDNHCVCLNIGK